MINIITQFNDKVRLMTQEEVTRALAKWPGCRYWAILLRDGSMIEETCDWNADEKCVTENMVAICWLEDHWQK